MIKTNDQLFAQNLVIVEWNYVPNNQQLSTNKIQNNWIEFSINQIISTSNHLSIIWNSNFFSIKESIFQSKFGFTIFSNFIEIIELENISNNFCIFQFMKNYYNCSWELTNNIIWMKFKLLKHLVNEEKSSLNCS